MTDTKLTQSDWYFILTAVSKVAPFSEAKREQKLRVAAIVQDIYHSIGEGKS